MDARKSLEFDLIAVRDALDYLGKHPESNFDITGPSKNYLMPFFWGDSPEEGPGFVRPIEHENGLFMYYLRLKNIIEEALEKGAIPASMLPRNAPEYLESFAWL